MNQSDLVQLVKILKKSEAESFGKWISSIYQSKRPDISALYQEIKRALKSGARIDKSDLLKAIYRDKNPTDSNFRKTMSILKKELETFLVFQELKSQKQNFDLELAKILRKRSARELFKKQLNKIEDGIEVLPVETSERFYYQYKVATEKYEFDSREKRGKFEYLEGMMEDFSKFFLLETLKRSCHLFSHQTISSKEYQLNFLNEALQYAEESDEEKNPAFKIYYWIYQSYANEDDTQSFEFLKSAIEKYWLNFAPSEIRDIYLFSINICIRQLNRGSKPFLGEALKLYQSALEKEVLYEDGMISPFTYKNIVSIALALGEQSWAFDFLHDQKQYLDPANRENTFAANLATYYYKVGQLDKAMDLLQEISFKDVYDNLTYRALLMRIYFQLKEYSALEHHLESFASYLYRHKNLGYHKDLYKNLIRIMRKIIRSNLRETNVKEKIIAEIEASQQLAEKSWLLSTIGSDH